MSVDLATDVVVRWNDPETAHLPVLAESGAQCVLLSDTDAAFSNACSVAGLATAANSDFQFVTAQQLRSAKPGNNVVLTNGVWPGIRRPPNVKGRGDETASA